MPRAGLAGWGLFQGANEEGLPTVQSLTSALKGFLVGAHLWGFA